MILEHLELCRCDVCLLCDMPFMFHTVGSVLPWIPGKALTGQKEEDKKAHMAQTHGLQKKQIFESPLSLL